MCPKILWLMMYFDSALIRNKKRTLIESHHLILLPWSKAGARIHEMSCRAYKEELFFQFLRGVGKGIVSFYFSSRGKTQLECKCLSLSSATDPPLSLRPRRSFLLRCQGEQALNGLWKFHRSQQTMSTLIAACTNVKQQIEKE